MIYKFDDLFQTPKEALVDDWDHLHMELHGHIGKEVKTALVVGNPHQQEEWRLLKDVSFIETHHGVSILLEMEDIDTKETVSLMIPNVRSARYDNSQPTHLSKMIKYHFDAYNQMNEYGFLIPDAEKRAKNKNFKMNDKEKILEEYMIITGRIFMKDE